MADYLKLFYAKRLTPSEPHHLTYIKGRLAALKVEDPKGYEDYSEHYGTTEVVEVVEEVVEETPVEEEELILGSEEDVNYATAGTDLVTEPTKVKKTTKKRTKKS